MKETVTLQCYSKCLVAFACGTKHKYMNRLPGQCITCIKRYIYLLLMYKNLNNRRCIWG